MRRLPILLVGILVGMLLMLGSQALADGGKHFACYSGNNQPLRSFNYLPNGADPCPYGWTKIDWVDD